MSGQRLSFINRNHAMLEENTDQGEIYLNQNASTNKSHRGRAGSWRVV